MSADAKTKPQSGTQPARRTYLGGRQCEGLSHFRCGPGRQEHINGFACDGSHPKADGFVLGVVADGPCAKQYVRVVRHTPNLRRVSNIVHSGAEPAWRN